MSVIINLSTICSKHSKVIILIVLGTKPAKKNTQLLSAIKIIAAAINLGIMFGVHMQAQFSCCYKWLAPLEELYSWKSMTESKYPSCKQWFNSALFPGQPKFCLGRYIIRITCPNENFNYGSLEKLFPYKLCSWPYQIQLILDNLFKDELHQAHMYNLCPHIIPLLMV